MRCKSAARRFAVESEMCVIVQEIVVTRVGIEPTTL